MTNRYSHIRYEWIALSVTTIGALLASIDTSAVIIALPDISASLRADFITLMWVLLGYMLIIAAVVPVVGRLADMFGRKNLYNVGFIIFIIGSLLCSFITGTISRLGSGAVPHAARSGGRPPPHQQRSDRG